MALSELPRKLYPDREEFISEENLKDTVKLLENLKFSESEIASNFKEWVAQREKTIERIEILEKKLENVDVTCSTAHAVGCAMEAVGGVAFIAGTILTAFGHKYVGEFLTKKVSTVSTYSGMATAKSSSVAKTGLTAYTMKEARELLQLDQERTRLLESNLQNSKIIDSRLSRIFNCSVLSNFFLHVVQLVKEGIVLLQAGDDEISVLRAELKSKARKYTDISDLPEIVFQNVCKTLKNLIRNRKVCKAVWNICEIIKQSPLAVEVIKFNLRITYQIFDILKVDVFSSLLGLDVMKTSSGIITSSGIMATKCFLSSIQVAVNVLAVISAVKNVQEENEFVKMLKELRRALILELSTVQKHYLKLN